MSNELEFKSLRDIGGVTPGHWKFLEAEVGKRREALEHVTNVIGLAEHVGGSVEKLGLGEEWTIKKEIFPGVEIFFVYRAADEEFASDVKVLYGGDRIAEVRGEDLVALTIGCLNHMLRYVRRDRSVKTIPQICYRV